MIGLLASPVTRWLFGAAVAVGVLASIYAKGRIDGKEAMRQTAIIEAGKRIKQLETNNDAFRNSSARERCLAFMRHSGLPDTACD